MIQTHEQVSTTKNKTIHKGLPNITYKCYKDFLPKENNVNVSIFIYILTSPLTFDD